MSTLNTDSQWKIRNYNPIKEYKNSLNSFHNNIKLYIWYNMGIRKQGFGVFCLS